MRPWPPAVCIIVFPLFDPNKASSIEKQVCFYMGGVYENSLSYRHASSPQLLRKENL